MEFGLVLIILGLAFGFYMAWSIGANDVANAMGTSVGSGALTLRGAVVLAAILEFAGALLVGSHVTETIRGGIISPMAFAEEPILLVCGMLAALLAAGAWLQLASYLGWPVSTTHSIVGAIVGFAAVAKGVDAVNWSVLLGIVGSWLITPVIAGAISYIIFTLILRLIFYAPFPVQAARRATPWLVFSVFFVMTLMTVYKGLANLKLNLTGPEAIVAATVVGMLAAWIAYVLVRRSRARREAVEPVAGSARYRARALQKAAKHLRRVEAASGPETAPQVSQLLAEVVELAEQTQPDLEDENDSLQQDYRHVERIFIYLQILSACFVAFAHGANDVANAIGPLATVVSVAQTGVVSLESSVPPWLLLLGGIGIVIGLSTWGWRVIQTIGRRITELTPSRGFAAEFGAAMTIIIASRAGLPISTTQTLVGAVLGVGLARGFSALNLNTVRDIIASWIITVPAGAGLAILFYYTLVLIFT